MREYITIVEHMEANFIEEAMEVPQSLAQLTALKQETAVAQTSLPLWRGIGGGLMGTRSKLTSDFAYIDPAEGDPRTTRESTRFYDLILAHHPAWLALPNRKRSIICSTSRNHASKYGRAYRVYPLGDPPVVVCSGHDFWDSFPAMADAGLHSPATISMHLAREAERMHITLPADDFTAFGKALNRMAETYRLSPKRTYTATASDDLNSVLFTSGDPLATLMRLFDPVANKFRTMPLSRLTAAAKGMKNREVWLAAPCVLVSERYLAYPR